MLNKKGFTIAEVMVSFSLIAVILASVVASTMYYRDKLKQEEVKSQLIDFKNNITKIVYDDIINNKITKVESCIGASNCINFVDNKNNSYTLKIIEYNEATATTKRGVYLSYNGIKYMLPDSDLGTGYDRICDFVGGINIEEYESELYKVKMAFRHKDMDLHYDLLFVIS